MTPEDAIGAFERGFQTATARIAIASINWNEFSSSFARGEAPPLFQNLLSRVAPSLPADIPASHHNGHPPSFAATFRALTPSERAPKFYSFLRDQLASLIAAELPGQLAPDESIIELGLDSLMTVEIRNKLAGAFEISLPVTSLFDYPAPKALLSHIATLSGWDVSNNLERECALSAGGAR